MAKILSFFRLYNVRKYFVIKLKIDTSRWDVQTLGSCYLVSFLLSTGMWVVDTSLRVIMRTEFEPKQLAKKNYELVIDSQYSIALTNIL